MLEDALLAELVIRDVEDIVRRGPARDAAASPGVSDSDRGRIARGSFSDATEHYRRCSLQSE